MHGSVFNLVAQRTIKLACALTLLAPVGGALAANPVVKAEPWEVEWSEYVGGEMIREAAAACPLVETPTSADFDSCRAALFKSKYLQENFRDFILWGGGTPGTAVEHLSLTQFGSQVWQGLYMSLFMYTGNYKTEHLEDQNRILVRAEAVFRDEMKPGEYPYPFWHEASKWDAYLKATEMVFTMDIKDARVISIQRSPHGVRNEKIHLAKAPPPRKFKKDEWMWRDDKGVLQPKVTLFDGLYDSNNPHLGAMEATYKDFALELRDNTCMVCHVPNNPEKMRHLVLLQTPAHAAGEIDRIIRIVKGNAMPQKSWAGPKGFKDPATQARFLSFAEAFKAQVDAAAGWEAQHAVVK